MSDEKKKFAPDPFPLYADPKNRADEVFKLTQFIDTLDIKNVYRVKVLQGEEGRRDIANRCYQLVMGQVIRQVKGRNDKDNPLDYEPSVIAGKLKYHILLPLKLIMAAEYDDDDLRDEAEFERGLCDLITKNIDADNLYQAYDRAIRSKTLKIKPFARYLDAAIDKLALQGFVIKLKPSDKSRALGEQYSQPVAA